MKRKQVIKHVFKCEHLCSRCLYVTGLRFGLSSGWLLIPWPLSDHPLRARLCINRHFWAADGLIPDSVPPPSGALLTCELHILAARVACPPCVAFSRFPHVPILQLRSQAAGGRGHRGRHWNLRPTTLIPARKNEWERRYVWTWARPDKCSWTKWLEVNVLTKHLAHFNFKPLWHEQMREESLVLRVERRSSRMLVNWL